MGLVQGKQLSVDGSFVEANAAKESRIPREQLGEAARVHHTVRQYLKELEQQNPVEEPVHEQDQVSTTDPDSTYAAKGGTLARLGYYDNYLVEKKVEALFAELKNQIGLRRLRLRRLKFVREQFLLAAAAQNIKRLVRFLNQPKTPTVEATA